MKYIIVFFSFIATQANAQQNLTPEMLWRLGRISGASFNADKTKLIYNVSIPNVEENKSKTTSYSCNLDGSNVAVFEREKALSDLDNFKLSPDGTKCIFTKNVKLENIFGLDKYPELKKSNAMIYTDLNQRHWDTWEDGEYQHVFLADWVNGNAINEIDLMPNEKYDCPQMPFGGEEDLLWTPDGKSVLYVSKKKYGVDYAKSTNTDIYSYNIETKQTTNITEGMMGYDLSPSFSPDGKWLAFTSMKRDGFEADKQDIVVMNWATKNKINLTEKWDETVNAYMWSNDGKHILFEAPTKGTLQLFDIIFGDAKKKFFYSQPVQITNGQFDINGLVGQVGNKVYVTRSDMNHASEVYAVSLMDQSMQQITHINDGAYKNINMCKVEPRFTKASDGKDLFSWVIYPPNFDPNKKYPTLLYCQGGPQGALSQFYSFRWNFQLMASQGYIVIAPNRRGMHGWGVKWNEDISGDWGGQAIRDYYSAIDDLAKENYVDKNRLGAVGASYGGYSVFMLAGTHNNRFKTFIAHDGLFDIKSWYGTTEELWFAGWDIGKPYWEDVNNKSYSQFNPSTMIDKWNTPIMIVQGGKDFRVGIEQGLQAFQAARLKGIKSKLLYLPEENHWVLKAQNAQVWQREFFSWLKETL